MPSLVPSTHERRSRFEHRLDGAELAVLDVRAPAAVYALYCQRGDMENRLKELHHGLALDRTSCSRFWANQFRVLLTAAAYVLLQALRQQAHGTDCATAHVSTLRERLLKLAVGVERSVRRIALHLPRSAPWGTTWQRVAVAVGVVPG